MGSKIWHLITFSFFFSYYKIYKLFLSVLISGADLGGGCRGCTPTPPEMTCGFLIQLVFRPPPKKTMWFIGVEVKQETSTPPPKKNPGSAPEFCYQCIVTDELVFLPQKWLFLSSRKVMRQNQKFAGITSCFWCGVRCKTVVSALCSYFCTRQNSTESGARWYKCFSSLFFQEVRSLLLLGPKESLQDFQWINYNYSDR